MTLTLTIVILVGIVLAVVYLGTYSVEPFSGAASVDPRRMPECVSRSTDAQSLVSRIANNDSDEANELRLLTTKLCCMEADIASPSPGTYRTFNLQFRTSDDIEPPATIVGRCLQGAVNTRDIELIVEKFSDRGHDLIRRIGLPKVANGELDNVVAQLNFAMTSFCLKPSPRMDTPAGVRDVGYWETDAVADLSQYQGVSAVPK